MVHGLNCSTACGILLDQGLNLRPPALAGRFLTTAPPGKPYSLVLRYFSLTRVAIQRRPVELAQNCLEWSSSPACLRSIYIQDKCYQDADHSLKQEWGRLPGAFFVNSSRCYRSALYRGRICIIILTLVSMSCSMVPLGTLLPSKKGKRQFCLSGYGVFVTTGIQSLGPGTHHVPQCAGQSSQKNKCPIQNACTFGKLIKNCCFSLSSSLK